MTVEGRVSVAELLADPPRIGDTWGRLGAIATGVAVVCLAAAYFIAGGGVRFLHAYFVGYLYVFTIASGGLFFVLLQHTTRSGWSVVVRRIAEGVGAVFPLLTLLALPIVLNAQKLYPWVQMRDDPAVLGRGVWQTLAFFQVRIVLYLLVLSGIGVYFLSRSTRQDHSGEVALTLAMERRAAPLMVLYAITLSLVAFDMLMSLEPHWFSTIFGVYLFSSSFVSFLAAFPVLVYVLARGAMKRAVNAEHYQDMGKLLFGFIIFWAYIAFSQYLLIWYGNLPEETSWYARRQSGGYLYLSLALLVGHFIIPFVLLIGRKVKRRKKVLVGLAAYMLVMHLLDTAYLVTPDLSPTRFEFGLPDLLTTAGLVGLSLTFMIWLLKGRSLVPIKDPRLAESLSYENV